MLNGAMSTPLENFALENNTLRALKSAGFNYVHEIMNLHEADFLRIPGINTKCLEDLSRSLVATELWLHPYSPHYLKRIAAKEARLAKIIE